MNDDELFASELNEIVLARPVPFDRTQRVLD